MNNKTACLKIKTPEGIEFSINLAGPTARFLAWLIDTASILAVISVAGLLINIIAAFSPGIASAFGILGYFFVSIGYGIVLEWFWHGQTIGKRVFRLRVIDEQCLHMQFSQIVVRNLLRFVDSLPMLYLVGGLTCLVSSKAQRLGDMAANTVVIWLPTIRQPDVENVLSDKYNSFHDYPHIEARLRQRVSPHEANIALQALLRRDELDPVARIQLFADLALHFKNTVVFPQEAVDGLSDEKYILNVVDVLYNKRT